MREAFFNLFVARSKSCPSQTALARGMLKVVAFANPNPCESCAPKLSVSQFFRALRGFHHGFDQCDA
jgi:hypothetical protein